MKNVALVTLLFGASMVQAEIITPPVVPQPPTPVVQTKKKIRPVKALQRLHDNFVNLAVHISSLGIDPPKATELKASALEAKN